MKIYETRKNMCLKDNILKDKYGIYLSNGWWFC